MSSDEIAEQFERIRLHLIADGRDQEAVAYSNAADILRTTDFIPANPAELTGIGDVLRDDVMEYQRTGSIEKLTNLKEKHPYVEELTKVNGVGPTTAKRIHETLGIESIDELIKRSDELDEVYRIGETTAENIEQAARRNRKRNG